MNPRYRPGAIAPASLVTAGLVLGGLYVVAETAAELPDARTSDPVAMGWMIGAPPPPPKMIRYGDGSYYTFPQTRWSFSNMRQFLPTRVVARGTATASVLPRVEDAELNRVSFLPIGGAAPMTWEESLYANYTDGILVLHKGRIVYERYFGVLTPIGQHYAFSVTKSFVATLAATLISEGTLEYGATVGKYVPDLKDSGFGDATLGQLMDM